MSKFDEFDEFEEARKEELDGRNPELFFKDNSERHLMQALLIIKTLYTGITSGKPNIENLKNAKHFLQDFGLIV
ncbi:MAG TPA: hypothetical protein PK397_13220 [Ignavibacteriaceae bacterium]|nr:hypothetical protein [Ignavibacteriaceae bacterium]